MLTWLKGQFVCQEWKLYTGVRPIFLKGREGFLEQERFDKHFIYDHERKPRSFSS